MRQTTQASNFGSAPFSALSLAETDASGSTLPTYTWQYDADNRVTQSGSSYPGDGTVTYGYDCASQLTSAAYSSPSSGVTSPQTFSYDANDNRNSTGYVTGPNNELLSDGTYSYQVDANGNEIARWVDNNGVRESSPQPGDTQITVYGWDYRNRLTTATSYADYTDYHLSQNATQTIQYTYDVFNRRISETVTTGGVSTTEYFVYDGQQVLLQLSATGAVTERYLWGPAADKVLAEESASGVSWLLTDGQGSVRDVVTYTAGATAIADHIDYSAFGVEYETTPSADPGIGFAGQFWDAAAGSYYCEARSYNPSTGRYESVDPTGFSAGDPNLYAYVFNDPTNLVDPTGEAVARGPTVPMLAAPGTTWVWPWDYSNASWNPYDTLQLWTGVNKQVFPHGGGVLGSACAEAGMVTGAALEFFAGVGVFSNGAGVFGGGGGVKPLDPSVSWPKPAMVGGAYAGGGGGVFLTNATSVMGIGGEFQTFNLNVGCGPAKFSASYAQSSDGIWMLSVLPPVAGDGLGFDVSTYQTDTRTIGW
jgi:RHS repeat-associated protein